MSISEEGAKQFLDAMNDYISDGDIVIDAISPEKAGNMYRRDMDNFLFELFEAVLKLKESPK